MQNQDCIRIDRIRASAGGRAGARLRGCGYTAGKSEVKPLGGYRMPCSGGVFVFHAQPTVDQVPRGGVGRVVESGSVGDGWSVIGISAVGGAASRYSRGCRGGWRTNADRWGAVIFPGDNGGARRRSTWIKGDIGDGRSSGCIGPIGLRADIGCDRASGGDRNSV